jgi:uncharacterized protein YbjT (DUF2867 family)
LAGGGIILEPSEPKRRVLLTGATGYVGGRLLEALEPTDVAVRCMARKPEHLAGRVSKGTEVVAGDCLDAASLTPALRDVETAFYLVHSMGATGDFAEKDREAALNFGEAARAAGVKRIVYLGGLGDSGKGLSQHLRSRQETGEALRGSGVPVVEFRASIILGSGSLSFELIRALVERLPVMICPRWVGMKAQPIHIQDVVSYLVASLDLPHGNDRVYEIGGTEVVSYKEIMQEYARQRGLRRFMVPVPLLTPYISSLWLGLTTPVYARVGRKLIASIRNSTVVQDDSARRDFGIVPVGLAESISLAVRNEDRRLAATRWSGATSVAGPGRSWGGVQFGTRLVDSRSVPFDGEPSAAFAPIREIGGKRGWYHANFLWSLRGFMDLLVGGVGMRRGRRDPDRLEVGDAVDCWRVEAFEPDRLLRLSAEMKLPGRAWLQFEVKETDSGTTIHQTAMFDPVGLLGQLYWYSIYPLHDWIFSGMLKAIAARGGCKQSPSD